MVCLCCRSGSHFSACVPLRLRWRSGIDISHLLRARRCVLHGSLGRRQRTGRMDIVIGGFRGPQALGVCPSGSERGVCVLQSRHRPPIPSLTSAAGTCWGPSSVEYPHHVEEVGRTDISPRSSGRRPKVRPHPASRRSDEGETQELDEPRARRI